MMKETNHQVGQNGGGYQLSGTGGIPSRQHGASDQKPEVMPVSEIDRETRGVDANLTYLENRLQILQQRLGPVILNMDTAKVGHSPGEPGPSSELGGQLRGYANRAEAVAATVDYLLEHLALA